MRSWQEALSDHPILAERQDTRASEREKNGTAPVCTADTTRRTSLLAMRGTDWLLVVQNELRMTSMAHAKRAIEEDATKSDRDRTALLSYKVLTSELLDFPIQSIHVNPTGKLLAVVGIYSLVIVILPRRGYMKQVGVKCPVNAIRVGSYFHAPHGSSPIAQCRWHPYGLDGASLVVLTEDAMVREYNVVKDIDEPQQTMAVLGQATTLKSTSSSSSSSAFLLSAEDEDEKTAVSLSFGCDSPSWISSSPVREDSQRDDADTAYKTGPGWLLFSLFVLMQSGDVYVVCPFMPKHAALPRSQVEWLAAHEARKAQNITLALRFLGDLVHQMKEARTSLTETDAVLEPMDQMSEGLVPAMLPRSVPHRAATQGPCLMRPTPIEFDEEVAPSACDLLVTCVRSDDAKTALDIVGIATREGTLSWGLLATPLEPQWVGRAPASMPTIAICECMDLELKNARSFNVIQFLKDPLYPDMVFLTHADGMQAVSLRPWTDPLLDAMASNDPQAVKRTMSEPTHTAIKQLVRLDTPTPSNNDQVTPSITGALAINDVYLSYAFFVLTSDTQLVARELGLRPVTDMATIPHDVREYKPLMSEPFVPPPVLTQPRPVIAAARGELQVTPETLRAFGQATEKLHKRLEDVAHAGHAVQLRVAQQMREMQRQITELAHASDRIKKIHADVLAARLTRIEDTQRSTVRRLDTLLQQLMDEHAPQLSVYERRWFDELQRMSREFGDGKASAREQLLKVCRPALRCQDAVLYHLLTHQLSWNISGPFCVLHSPPRQIPRSPGMSNSALDRENAWNKSLHMSTFRELNVLPVSHLSIQR